jgi:hypothetical protein
VDIRKLFTISKLLMKEIIPKANLSNMIDSNLIRIDDHLTFNLDLPESEDAQIIDSMNVIYHSKKISVKDWLFEAKRISEFTNVVHRFVFHRESRLSLQSLIDLVTSNEMIPE